MEIESYVRGLKITFTCSIDSIIQEISQVVRIFDESASIPTTTRPSEARGKKFSFFSHFERQALAGF